MEDAERIHTTQTQGEKEREMRSGANWFFLIAALSVINSLIVVFSGTFSFALGLGFTQFVDGRMLAYIGQGSPPELRWVGLAVNILIAALFAAFGHFARRGSDIAFIVGMFLYAMDALLILGFKDYFGFVFHLVALFFVFKGLLGSRKRFDPSV